MPPYIGQGQVNSGNASQVGTVNTNTLGASGSNTATTATGSGASSGVNANNYNPWQKGLQAQAGGAAGNFLQTGNLPGTFGAPPQVTQAYIDNFNKNVAPQLAAQYGAGSPAIGSQMAGGLEQLMAQVYQNQSNNFGNAVNSAAGIGFTAIGNQNQQQQQQQQAGNSATHGWSWQNETQNINMANAASNLGQSMPGY